MTFEIAQVLCVLLIAVILFVSDKLRPDVIAMLVMLSLVIIGLITPQQAFLSFSNPAVITVGAVLVISHALFQTGVADFLGGQILRFAGESEMRLVACIMITVGIMSAFMNNIGATAVLLPAVMGIAKKTGISASKLLIPLSFASLMGGNMTLIGTPPNILVSAALQQHQGIGFDFFDFAPMGILILISGIIYMVLIGRHLLPHRAQTPITNSYHVRQYMSEICVLPNSPLVGKTTVESRFGHDYNLTIVGLIRGYEPILSLHRDEKIQANDILLVKGSLEKIVKVRRKQNLLIQSQNGRNDALLQSSDTAIVEVLLGFGTKLAGQTLEGVRFREKHRLSVLALWRRDHLITKPLSSERLQPGDILLVQGRKEDINLLRTDSDFLFLEPVSLKTRRTNKAPHALAVLAGLLIGVLAGLPISLAGLIAVALLVLLGVLNMEEVYQAIEWRAIFFISGMLSLGVAMETTNAAKYLADIIVDSLTQYGPVSLLLGIYVLTAVLTQLMSNSAATVLIAPVAINVALDLGADPRPFLMTVVIAASTIFLTPIGHAANILVFGPGRYRFLDYTKVGSGLMVIHITLTMSVLPYIWPLFP